MGPKVLCLKQAASKAIESLTQKLCKLRMGKGKTHGKACIFCEKKV